MLDPQLPDKVLPDKITAEQLHFLNVLDFGGFHESRKAYLNLLKARFSLSLAMTADTVTSRLKNKVEVAKEAFIDAYDEEARVKENYIYDGKIFKIRSTEVNVGKHTFHILAGIHSGTKDTILAGKSSRELAGVKKGKNDNDGVSLFSDGTRVQGFDSITES